MRDFANEGEVYRFLRWKLRELWGARVEERYGLGRLSPDVDLLVVAGGGVFGLEVKYFQDRPLRAYEGLGEALALLLYCFDGVYLVHVFDSSLRGVYGEVVERALRLVDLTPLGYVVVVGRGDPEVLRVPRGNPFKLRGECEAVGQDA
ncbi:hypothetical protein [Thermofilum pendens]|uniref:Endonuclease n=1 Tax=Thermofilum pendens (strain DSM 2475 / Hrk 5) TaxID=368408 RepID=A1RYV8_THEPD|nr:hypothetical protein [Thermofilum pendens]ABL78388.1 hypothetical protein Tpen_0988 [Thermofilum pendens Hrk 5]